MFRFKRKKESFEKESKSFLSFLSFFKKERLKSRDFMQSKANSNFVIPSRFWCGYINWLLSKKELEAFVRTKGKSLFQSDSFYWTAIRQKHGFLLFMVPDKKEDMIEIYEGKYPLILHLPEGKYAIQTDENWLNVEIKRLKNGDITIETIVFDTPLENEGYIPKSYEELLELAEKPKYQLKWSLKDPCSFSQWIIISFLAGLIFLGIAFNQYRLILNETNLFLEKALLKIESTRKAEARILKNIKVSQGNISQTLNFFRITHQITPPNWIRLFKIKQDEIKIEIACLQPPCNLSNFICKETDHSLQKRIKIVECYKNLKKKK